MYKSPYDFSADNVDYSESLPESPLDAEYGLPTTTAEWSAAVSDVKREYLNRRYRPCANRCNEILDSIQDSTLIEPAYIIYLHFYAASAQEMLAKTLHQSAPLRMLLLHQARVHYCRSSTLISAADAAVGPALHRRSSGTATSIIAPPSFHSPTSSISSQASLWTASHGASPASSISSIQDTPRPKHKKRVTFSDVPIQLLERPDSPTLGLGTVPGSVGSSSPEPMSEPSVPPPRSCLSLRATLLEPIMDLDMDPFRHARSVHRYGALLNGLQQQVSRHLKFIEAEIQQAELPDSPPVSPPMTINTQSMTPAHDKQRSPELQARIDKLRASGWKRRSFDARRYEELCDDIIMDMAK